MSDLITTVEKRRFMTEVEVEFVNYEKANELIAKHKNIINDLEENLLELRDTLIGYSTTVQPKD